MCRRRGSVYAEQRRIKLSRRMSGGGSVYHDMGNANISIISNLIGYEREDYSTAIKDGLNEHLGISIVLTRDHDMCLETGGSSKGELSKISGSAARKRGNTMLHHCTLLLNVDLVTLKNVLCPEDNLGIKSSGIESRRAPLVANVSSHVNGATWLNLFEKGIKSIWKHLPGLGYTTCPASSFIYPRHHAELIREIDRHSSWDHVYGSTPKFSVTLSSGEVLNVEKGIVVTAGSPYHGKRYGDSVMMPGNKKAIVS
ncbi:hypothetical protein ACOME3_009899 [Neoechinorhynchus agilis]